MSEICRGCGFCCDGTIYQAVDLDADEPLARFRAEGMVITRLKRKISLQQPCSAFDGEGCTIYSERPRGCRTYRCALLRRVESGEVSADEAHRLIAAVDELRHRLRTELEALVGRGTVPLPLSELFVLMHALEEQSMSRDDDLSSLHIDIAMLRVLLERHFEPREDAEVMGEPQS